jgi:hypothetical protein
MSTFTPTTPVAKTIPTTTTDDAHTCKFSRLSLDYDPDDGSLVGVSGTVQNYDSGGALIPNTEANFNLTAAQVATKFAEAASAADDKQMTIEKAVYELLQAENNPETGSPYLPAGAIS